MTLHCAKGLEFPVVFIIGLEERLFPHARSSESLSGIEEERRLFYVGITRAMKRLCLTHASMRSVYGRMQIAEPSRFIDEIPPEVLKIETSASLGLYNSSARRREENRAGTRQRFQDDGGQDAGADLPSFSHTARGTAPRLKPSSRQAVNMAPPVAHPVVSRGAGRGGEVTVEFDPEADSDAFTPDDFRLGMEVLHGKYGRGTIIQKEGKGERVKLTVSFPGFGRKRLMARYANLRVAL